jgi:hypothetical protein
MSGQPKPRREPEFNRMLDRLIRNYDIGVTFCITRAFRQTESEIRDSFHGRYFDLQLTSGDGKGLTLAEAARTLELAAAHLREQSLNPHPFGIHDKPFNDCGDPNYLVSLPLRLKHAPNLKLEDTE